MKFWLFYIFFGYFYVVSVEGSYYQRKRERSAESDWGYTLHNGPPTWGGICQIGKNQSPINIQLGTVIVKDFPLFVFGEDYLNKQNFYAKNNGHTIYVALEDDSIQPVLSGGGLKDEYIFKQLHFHWESEHEFDGKRADLEMHLVHYNSKYRSFAEASTKADGIVVLAVIFDEKNETNHSIENFFENILHVFDFEEHHSYTPPPTNFLIGNDEEIKPFSFALRDLLPKYVSRFFRYQGSLTTPNCGEVVQWTVFINRLPVSNKTLMTFRTFQDHEGNKLRQNFRPPQNLNGRKVYIQIKNYEEQRKSECESLTGSGSKAKSLLTFYVLHYYLFILSNIHK